MTDAHLPALMRRPIPGLVALFCLAAVLGGCNRTVAEKAYPADYRERHPIALREGEHTVELFLARKRGGLTPAQRADVLAFAQTWRREATSGIIIEVPQGGSTAAAASESMHEVRAIFAASGVPAQAIAVRGHRPPAATLGTITISYATLTAEAGPCGQWPKDIGISVDSDHNSNRPYWNFGCATQRNLAAMVANPADLVQPRGEDAALSSRRSTVFEKYRKGEDPATRYQGYQKGISDLAKQ
jgi:pilus assembly protein CpaD